MASARSRLRQPIAGSLKRLAGDHLPQNDEARLCEPVGVFEAQARTAGKEILLGAVA